MWALENAGQKMEGANYLISGTIPQGAGLASSAALEAAIALAASSVEGFTMERPAIAKALQHAENDFIGLPSGIHGGPEHLAGASRATPCSWTPAT